MPTIFRARLVVPMGRPVIENGAVAVAAGRIRALDRWPAIRSPRRSATVDLGEVALLPGLINAHCHLDYTDMGGQLLPQKSFSDWIKSILALKTGWSYSEYAQSWLRGAQMLARSGTTTVVDIESVPELLPEVWTATRLRVISLLEMTGVRARRQPDAVLAEALGHLDRLPRGCCRVGLSPHAPYSTTPTLLRKTVRATAERRCLLATHLAESLEEFEMFRHARGPMFTWLRRNERDMTDCGHRSPVQHLAALGYLGRNLLGIHANYLAPGDTGLLAARQVSVVHCPRSHAYFQHRRFPYQELAAAGVNVCLGTDSLATVIKLRGQPLELNLFAEMRAFSGVNPEVAPERIVRMVTSNPAAAIGQTGKLGELKPRAYADLIAVPFSGPPQDVWAAIVQHHGPISFSTAWSEGGGSESQP